MNEKNEIDSVDQKKLLEWVESNKRGELEWMKKDLMRKYIEKWWKEVSGKEESRLLTRFKGMKGPILLYKVLVDIKEEKDRVLVFSSLYPAE